MKKTDKKTSPIKDWQNIAIMNKDSEVIAVITNDQIIIKEEYNFKIDVGL
jgi:hypothetical protein